MISIGLISAPRTPPLLATTLTSLRDCGFEEEINIFPEPGIQEPVDEDLGRLRWHATDSERPLGNWENWRRAATWLVENSDEPFVFIGDDDFRLCPGARPRLEHALKVLPHHDLGFLSLYTPKRNLIFHHKKAIYGWQDIPVGFGGWGTVALVFRRENLIQILSHHETALYPLDRDADIFLSKLCAALGLRTWYHLPSLVQHMGGGHSTLGHGDFRGFEAVGFQEEYGNREEDYKEVEHSEFPLVSCIMPTRDRPGFAKRALEAFRGQIYPNRELIVVGCGDSGIRGEVESDPRMRYFEAVPYMTLGALRNLACKLAHGSIISFWDDDDWHGPERLTAQVEPLIDGRAEFTALSNPYHLDARGGFHYRPAAPGLAAQFYHFGIHTGTLVFKRELMKEDLIFPDMDPGEDYIFAKRLLQAGARLERISRDDVYLYVRHGSNTWPHEVNGEPRAPDWESHKGLPDFLPSEMEAFYKELQTQ